MSREEAGLHRYDGVVQDLSTAAGVAAGLARLGVGDLPPDPHDAAHLACVRGGACAGRFGDVPGPTAPTPGGTSTGSIWPATTGGTLRPPSGRRPGPGTSRPWPDAVDVAVTTLDAVRGAGRPRPARLGPGSGRRARPDHRPGGRAGSPPLRSQRTPRLVAHLETLADRGDPAGQRRARRRRLRARRGRRDRRRRSLDARA